ncbi:MAG TPA: ABC transporter substrate-binding protein [Sporichthyaceae bacterium]|jgi:branched-chain amino acid transport system substrate-binding protein|nr:ABC transporter substrate-binding protein [Sporichthyaceae bacterium]
MTVRRTSGPAGRRALVALVCLAALSACGTRVEGTAIEAGAGGGAVRLSPQTLAQLQPDPAKAAAAAATGIAAPVTQQAGAAPTTTVKTASEKAVTTGAVVAPAASHAAAALAAATGKAGPAVAAPAADAACHADAAPVPIGQIGTFSGVAGPITISARNMLGAWAKDINTRGGLACHLVEVYSEDDGGDPARAASEVQQMVASHHVVAFVASEVPLSIGGFRPALEAAKVPEIGGLAGTSDFFESRWIFPESAALDDQAIGLFRQGADLGHRRVGLLYCVEAPVCTEVDKRARAGTVKAAGAELVYDAPVSVAQPDYTAQCLNARDAKVDLFTLALDGASVGRVIRSCQAIGYRPLLGTGGGLLTPAQATDPTLRAFGAVSVSAEAPWILNDTPGLREYHQALARWLPNQVADGTSVMAWASAKLLEAAVTHLPVAARTGQVTAAMLVTALGGVHDNSLGGLTGPLTFSPGEQHAVSNGCVFYELLGPSGWTAPHGSKPVCVTH